MLLLLKLGGVIDTKWIGSRLSNWVDRVRAKGVGLRLEVDWNSGCEAMEAEGVGWRLNGGWGYLVAGFSTALLLI